MKAGNIVVILVVYYDTDCCFSCLDLVRSLGVKKSLKKIEETEMLTSVKNSGICEQIKLRI